MSEHVKFKSPKAKREWEKYRLRWLICTKCPLAEHAINHVLARGTIPCDLLIFGEAPGPSEDATGQPFKGPAGKLLDSMLTLAFQFQGKKTPSILIANVLCCFPIDLEEHTLSDRKFRAPDPSEAEACLPHVEQLIDIARPKALVLLGKVASKFIPRRDGMPTLELVHPSYIRRKGGQTSNEYKRFYLTLRKFWEGLR